MAFCMKCGQELPNGANFCLHCGTATGSLESKTNERKTVYEGELHRCPNCGEVLNSFVTNCPTCGHEIRSVNVNSPIKELVKKLEQTANLDEKMELIANFYVPNTKEDIYDFFILAASNLEDMAQDTNDAWRAKLEQTYHKAKMSFGNTSEFEYIETLYKRVNKKISKRAVPTFVRKNTSSVVAVGIAILTLIMLITGIVLAISLDDPALGIVLLLFSISGFCFEAVVIMENNEQKKKENRKKIAKTPNNSARLSPGKEGEEFYLQNYEDAIEELKEIGFKNIEAKPVKKGLLDTEGAIKSISIAGKTEFSEYDEFSINAKIIIRYYSKNY